MANDLLVIWADESTEDLDPQSRQQVLDFLERFCDDGRTVIMVPHDPVAADRTTHTLKLAEGAVIEDSGCLNLQAA